MFKKLTSLLIVVVMFTTFLCGCQNSNGTEADTPQNQTPSTASPETQAPPAQPSETDNSTGKEPESTAQKDPLSPSERPEQPKLPLSDIEPVLTYWIAFSSPAIDDLQTQYNVLQAKEITGVNIEYQVITPTVASEQFNLMVISGNYTDMVNSATSSYSGGGEKAVEDNFIIYLNDYVAQYAPNYLYCIQNTSDIYRDCIDDSGMMTDIKFIYTDPSITVGFLTRQDWLDKLGLDAPQTYDEFEAVLTAYKAAYDCSDPIFMTANCLLDQSSLVSGYGVPGFQADGSAGTGSHLYQIDGVVHSSFLEQGYKDYITMLNSWYNNGLISKSFIENSADMFQGNKTTLVVTDQCGIYTGSLPEFERRPSEASDPDFTLVALREPVQDDTELNHFGGQREMVAAMNSVSITTSCKDIGLALSWLNFWFSDAGITLANFGVLGETFNIVDGNSTLTELITQDPKGPGNGMALHLNGERAPTLKGPAKDYGLLWPEQAYAEKLWESSCDSSYYIPNAIQLTAEEGEIFNSFASDYETFAAENIVSFVIGEKPMSEWDDFVNRLRSMHLDESIQIYQDAMDRYLARY